MGKRRKEPNEIAAIKALTHPLRVHILIRMAEVGTLSARQYVRETGKTLNTVAYHLRILEKYGAVELADTAARRGATEHFFAIAKTSPLFRALLGSQLANTEPANEASGILGGLLGPAEGRAPVASMVPLELDAAGIEELREAVEIQIAEILSDVGERAKLRAKENGTAVQELHVGIAAFTWDKENGSSRRS